jgi:hypothetical protein
MPRLTLPPTAWVEARARPSLTPTPSEWVRPTDWDVVSDSEWVSALPTVSVSARPVEWLLVDEAKLLVPRLTVRVCDSLVACEVVSDWERVSDSERVVLREVPEERELLLNPPLLCETPQLLWPLSPLDALCPLLWLTDSLSKLLALSLTPSAALQFSVL